MQKTQEIYAQFFLCLSTGHPQKYYAQQLLPIKLLCIFTPNFLNGNEVTISLPFFSMRFSEGLAQNSANFLSFLSNS